jgi:hypothetical protein
MVVGGCAVLNYQPTYWVASLPWSIAPNPAQSPSGLVDVLSRPLAHLGFQQMRDYEDQGQSYAVFSIGIGLFASERLDVTIKRSTNQINIRDFRVPYESDFFRRVRDSIQFELKEVYGVSVDFKRVRTLE